MEARVTHTGLKRAATDPPAAQKRFRSGDKLQRRAVSVNRSAHDDSKLLVKGKTIHDPLHGHITLQAAVARLVDTPQFQRLAGLKQLGTADFVYRGAVHSRYEHSIGVAHLAELMCLSLRDHQPELGITDVDVLCVKIAGLCHDLGHGPFSHCWDGLFVKRLGVEWRHEQGSVDMLRHLLAVNGIDLREHRLDEEDVLFIEEQILGTPLEERRGRKGNDKEFLYDIVNNTWSGFDVDKLDYLLRDPERAGVSKDSIKINRFLELARVCWARDAQGRRRKTICYPEKMCSEALDVFATRFRLHRQMYQHKVVKQVELMYVDALLAANDFFTMPGSVDQDHPDGRWHLGECTRDMAAFTNLKDSVIDLIVHDPNPLLAPSKAIIQRVRHRQLYVCVGRSPSTADEQLSATEEQVALDIVAAGERARQRRRPTRSSRRSSYGSNNSSNDGGGGSGGGGGGGGGNAVRVPPDVANGVRGAAANGQAGSGSGGSCNGSGCNGSVTVVTAAGLNLPPSIDEDSGAGSDGLVGVGMFAEEEEESASQTEPESDGEDGLGDIVAPAAVAAAAAAASAAAAAAAASAAAAAPAAVTAAAAVAGNGSAAAAVAGNGSAAAAAAVVHLNGSKTMVETPPPLTVDDIIVEFMVLHHGQGPKDPVKSMRFFRKFDARDANTEARAVPTEKYAECLPANFEYRWVRVFCRDPSRADDARDAFLAWCKEGTGGQEPLSQAP